MYRPTLGNRFCTWLVAVGVADRLRDLAWAIERNGPPRAAPGELQILPGGIEGRISSLRDEAVRSLKASSAPDSLLGQAEEKRSATLLRWIRRGQKR